MNLTEQLIESNHLKTSRIIDAFRKIKRKDFILSGMDEEAELNVPLSIGFNQTISQPFTVAFMFELCQPKRGDKILDVGTGSGWTTALFAEIVGEKGKIYGIERICELKEWGKNNVKKYNFIESGRVEMFCSDGSKGLKKQSPFDVIHVGAAAAEIPQALLEQLAVGGRLVIPEGVEAQDIILIKKVDKDKFEQQRFPGFAFVPLVTKQD